MLRPGPCWKAVFCPTVRPAGRPADASCAYAGNAPTINSDPSGLRYTSDNDAGGQQQEQQPAPQPRVDCPW